MEHCVSMYKIKDNISIWSLKYICISQSSLGNNANDNY